VVVRNLLVLKTSQQRQGFSSRNVG